MASCHTHAPFYAALVGGYGILSYPRNLLRSPHRRYGHLAHTTPPQNIQKQRANNK
ncbi:hypothetical protein HMPREF0673_01543 [Leyella stercorea DSM 18206]|uniref:Uncharacterized protein n=1 Tax=Leyella stercorea DSM 18206 TaxID=1002367 RepID=G6AY34_9BACT|nr:hypothetical protein HMPREF0673_01543 [Leyella stercorea DSM 18206]